MKGKKGHRKGNRLVEFPLSGKQLPPSPGGEGNWLTGTAPRVFR